MGKVAIPIAVKIRLSLTIPVKITIKIQIKVPLEVCFWLPVRFRIAQVRQVRIAISSLSKIKIAFKIRFSSWLDKVEIQVKIAGVIAIKVGLRLRLKIAAAATRRFCGRLPLGNQQQTVLKYHVHP